jgi:hypothetical protein
VAPVSLWGVGGKSEDVTGESSVLADDGPGDCSVLPLAFDGLIALAREDGRERDLGGRVGPPDDDGGDMFSGEMFGADILRSWGNVLVGGNMAGFGS